MTTLFLVAALLSAGAPLGPAVKGSGTLYANIETTEGTIALELYEKEAPKNVASFVGLAMGTRTFTDPDSGKQVRRPFYDKTVFHWVKPNQWIRGGDPTTPGPGVHLGSGGPGYFVDDEITDKLRFDRAGRVAASSRFPNTNTIGSQFTIHLEPLPEADGKCTIFAQVVRGIEVARKISRSPTKGLSPLKPVVVKRIRAYRARKPRP